MIPEYNKETIELPQRPVSERDGVWHPSNGLKAEFRFVKRLPYSQDIAVIEIANGDSVLACFADLTWDKKDEPKQPLD